MITSLDVKQNSDNTTHVVYTVVFSGTNHQCYGNFDATTDEASTAFSGATKTDMWAGFKQLALTRLQTEATNALATVPTASTSTASTSTVSTTTDTTASTTTTA